MQPFPPFLLGGSEIRLGTYLRSITECRLVNRAVEGSTPVRSPRWAVPDHISDQPPVIRHPSTSDRPPVSPERSFRAEQRRRHTSSVRNQSKRCNLQRNVRESESSSTRIYADRDRHRARHRWLAARRRCERPRTYQ